MHSTKADTNGSISPSLSSPFKNFVNAETTAGMILLVFAIGAILLINSPIGSQFGSFWSTETTIQFGQLKITTPLSLWINDGLMALFFLVVGLEIKRELVVGELSTFKKAVLPALAALGGVVVPAVIYALIARSAELTSGWAIPTSTDIAFCLAALHVLGDRVPVGLKVFTVAAAIVDDLFGMIILAAFYSHGIVLLYLVGALLPLVLLFLVNRLNVRNPLIYLMLGAVLWCLLMAGGIHASVAGVVLAMFVPVRPTIDSTQFRSDVSAYINEFVRADSMADRESVNRKRKSAILAIEKTAIKVQSPLQRLEASIHPWVAYLILPIFALSNAGVSVSVLNAIPDNANLFLAIVIGLVVGKPLGITLFSYMAVAMRLAVLPQDCNFKQIMGAAALSGIGFTMSLFITTLAFQDSQIVELSRLSILVGSLAAWLIGTTILARTTSTVEERLSNRAPKPFSFTT